MTRTIYRGYDITSEVAGQWKVWNPERPGSFLADMKTEEEAMGFVDRHKRAMATAPAK